MIIKQLFISFEPKNVAYYINTVSSLCLDIAGILYNPVG